MQLDLNKLRSDEMLQCTYRTNIIIGSVYFTAKMAAAKGLVEMK